MQINAFLLYNKKKYYREGNFSSKKFWQITGSLPKFFHQYLHHNYRSHESLRCLVSCHVIQCVKSWGQLAMLILQYFKRIDHVSSNSNVLPDPEGLTGSLPKFFHQYLHHNYRSHESLRCLVSCHVIQCVKSWGQLAMLILQYFKRIDHVSSNSNVLPDPEGLLSSSVPSNKY